MASLLLTSKLTESFLGALLSVCRVDGEVNSEELSALETAAGELTGGRYDQETLLFSQVTPTSFAEAFRSGLDGPFRAAGTSSPAAIAQAFVRAALRIGRADGQLNESELRTICAFALALGTSSNLLKDLDAGLDDWLARAEH